MYIFMYIQVYGKYKYLLLHVISSFFRITTFIPAINMELKYICGQIWFLGFARRSGKPNGQLFTRPDLCLSYKLDVVDEPLELCEAL